MTDHTPPYHRWSQRQRDLFEVAIQIILCVVIGCGIVECVGPPRRTRHACRNDRMVSLLLLVGLAWLASAHAIEAALRTLRIDPLTAEKVANENAHALRVRCGVYPGH